MGCCFCCMSEDAQIQAVMEKLEVDRVANATHGHTKFWVGRILLTTNPLISPVSGKQCAYYRVKCEEHCKHVREETDPETGHVSYHEYWSWDHRFTEERKSDFLLADPQGTPCFVPSGAYKTKFYSVVDASNTDNSGMMTNMRGMITGDMGRSDLIEEMLRRNGQTGRFGRDDQGKFRYDESSFAVNEQVAILGTAQPHVYQGVNVTILNPPTTSILTEEYFEANEWSSNEKKSWGALTEVPSVIGSDDPKYFKGISVEDLPLNYSPFAFCAPVFYGAPVMQGQPMMQQQGMMQGQPMMQQQGMMQGQPMQQQGMMQGQPMMQQQGMMQGQPMMQQQGMMQGQPMMQQQGMMQGQPMMQQQPMQHQVQPMMQQQGMQPMQGQPTQQQNFGPSTVVPEEQQQQQQPAVMPTIGGVGPTVIPTIAPH